MTRLAVLLLIASVAVAEPQKIATHQIKLDGHTFTLPEGFTIERVAGPPLVDRPISASFDDRGRLYVTDSSGSNEKLTEQLKHPDHRVIRLEDTNGTGVFDKSTVFADKMMFPEGILWHRGHVYVSAVPQIWKLTDTDDDGVADKREVWFDPKTMTGCGNDLHGPYLGPDGWIYWCKGAFAKQEYALPNGKKFTTRASHIFRARPDGTGIEPVMTGGMDNPVGIAFLPNGERFFTTTFLQHPAAGKRDGIIHAVCGGIWGKDHDVIYDADHKWTSPHTMPVMTHMGPAAPCGLICYQSDALGKEYTSNLFACQFNMRKVSRHVLKPSGSTYTTEDYDFLVSDNTDFHPTDVIEDADGSLLVVNTGGWYKLCCPSSQLVKADVLGAIYRVRKEGAKVPKDPWGNQIDWKKEGISVLVYNLKATKAGPAFRHRVSEHLLAFGNKGIENMSYWVFKDDDAVDELTWLLAIGIATQIDSKEARKFVRDAVAEEKARDLKWEAVVQAAIHSMGLRRDKEAVPLLLEELKSTNLIMRRMAIEALGRIGDKQTAPRVVQLLADEKNDRALDHALTYALIELDNRDYLKSSLDNESPRVRRACLTALDQLGEKLDPKFVLAAMKSEDAALKETAQWIVGRHPEWGNQLVDFFADRLVDPKGDDLVPMLAKFAATPRISSLLSGIVSNAELDDKPRIVALHAMAAAGLKTPPDSWYEAIEKTITYEESKEIWLASIAALRAMPPAKKTAVSLTKKLFKLCRDTTSRDVILGALAVVPGGPAKVESPEFLALTSCVDKDTIPELRGLAADVISKTKFDSAQFDELIKILPTVSPLDLDRVLAAFAQTKDDEIGKKLIAKLNTPEVRPALRVDGVKERIKHFGPAVQAEAEKLYVVLNADLAKQREKLDEAAKTLKTGDIRRGQAVFNSTKTSCIACHTIGYVGGKIGPDLTRIGGIRSERDLLESILFPSASFVRSYEPVTVTTKDQKTFNGIPKKDAPDEMILILAADKEVRIAREDIEEVRPGKVSIMPDGLDKQLSPQELADLIAFLRACK
jgi:putative membrane-bound dehydrogenase-like protein